MSQGDNKRRAQRIRAVANLVERYFVQLKTELATTRDAFWERVEHALANAPPDAPPGNASPGKPLDPK
jgi:hypothetical protein